MQRQQFREETAPTTPLYNAEAVRQVLARASEIEAQQAEQGDLTPEQVEVLGTELGLSPDAVRRALGERESQIVTPAPSMRPRKRLTVAQMLTTPLPGLAYAAGAVTLLTLLATAPLLLYIPYIIVLLVIPMLLSVWFGWQRNDVRLGMATGFFLSVFVLLAFFVLTGAGRFGWLEPVVGIALGWFGAFLRERYEQEKAERAR